MSTGARSTVTALCYARKPGLSFETLVADLGRALGEHPQLGMQMSARYDDFVSFELPGACISLAQTDLQAETEGTASNYVECLVLSVGCDGTGEGHGPMFTNRLQLARRLAAQIESRYPADWFYIQDLPEVFDEDRHDAFIAQLLLRQPEPDVAEDDPDQPPSAFDPIQPTDILSDLAARFDAERESREAERAAAQARGEAVWMAAQAEKCGKARPRATHPATSADAERARAMRPEEDPLWDREGEPLLHRIAVHSLSAAMLAVALPAGAVLITLGVLGRESLLASSRITALTGVTVALSSGNLPAQILTLFS